MNSSLDVIGFRSPFFLRLGLSMEQAARDIHDHFRDRSAKKPGLLAKAELNQARCLRFYQPRVRERIMKLS
ncbi:MAG: hypothetical protein V4661_12935 [Pseudomonadota bacterium]|jgi:hypothetical protein